MDSGPSGTAEPKSLCTGTGEGEKNNCGHGATGIDNMWHDVNAAGDEMGAGSNPMWHAKNLEKAFGFIRSGL